MTNEESCDVLVVGAGNAALTAALAAAERGASVIVVEKAPIYLRGGNSYFAGGLFRFAYEGLEDVLDLVPDTSDDQRDSTDVGSYPQATFYSDVMRLTEGLSDPEMVQLLVSQSYPAMMWMKDQGVPWILAYGRQAFTQNGVLRFWGGLVVESVGAGKGLSDRLFELVERAGVETLYQTKLTALTADRRGRVVGATVRDTDGYREIDAKSVVLACGGFEANPGMRALSGGRLGACEGQRQPVQHGRRHPGGARYRRAALRPLERMSRSGLGPERPALRRSEHCRPLPEALVPVWPHRERRGQALRR